MADTGNEYPDTYRYLIAIALFCKQHGIEFYFIRSDWDYHGRTWQNLQYSAPRFYDHLLN